MESTGLQEPENLLLARSAGAAPFAFNGAGFDLFLPSHSGAYRAIRPSSFSYHFGNRVATSVSDSFTMTQAGCRTVGFKPTLLVILSPPRADEARGLRPGHCCGESLI